MFFAVHIRRRVRHACRFATLLQRARFTALTLGFVVGASHSAAQQAASSSAADSAFRRAQRMVQDGDESGGRALVDSMVRVSVEGTDAYAEALFWRATLAPDAATSQPDLLAIVVDYPLSP